MVIGKKAEGGTSGSTLIALLVSLALLVIIFGYLFNIAGLRDKINIFGPKANVDEIKLSCQTSCSQENAYTYCKESRTLIFADKLAFKGSCHDFEGLKGKYEFGDCDRPLDCSTYTTSVTCSSLGGTWMKKCGGDKPKNINNLVENEVETGVNQKTLENKMCCAPVCIAWEDACANLGSDVCIDGCKVVDEKCVGDKEFCESKTATECTKTVGCTLA